MSTVEAVADALRHDVLAGTLSPGAHLREAELVERYGVARHSVRSAIAELVRDGLLVHEPNRGAFVPEPDEAAGDDLYRFRRLLERGAVEEALARRATFDGAAAAHARLEALPLDGDWRDVAVAHADFHQAVIDAAGSARLSAAYAGVRAELLFFLATIRPRYTVRELAAAHALLLAALRTGDRRTALAAIDRDLAEGRRLLAAALRAEAAG